MTEEKKTKRKLVTTPIGEAKWFSVHKPDRFNNYTVELYLDDSPQSHKFFDFIMNFGEGSKPITALQDGGFKVKLKSKSKGIKKDMTVYEINPPAIYNNLGKRMEAEELARLSVGNGTKMRAKIEVSDYEFQGKKGVKLQLKSVQIVELIEFGGDMGFDAIELEHVNTDSGEEEITDHDF